VFLEDGDGHVVAGGTPGNRHQASQQAPESCHAWDHFSDCQGLMGKHATGHEKAGLRIEITIRRNPLLVSGNMKEMFPGWLSLNISLQRWNLAAEG
jgi:hypothetical protein